MTKLNIKLQSKRGASIMLALLLFLVCILAGVAALTAASANMGRHSYMRETQQKYLAVSSAAKLIRKQLNGMEIRCDYKFEATSWKNPVSTDVSPKFTVDESDFTDGSNNPDYYLNGSPEFDPDVTIIKYFKEYLKKMNYYEFYQKVKNEPNGVPWKKHIEASDPVLTDLSTPIPLKVVCDEVKDSKGDAITVDVEIAIDYTQKSFTLTASYDDYSIAVDGSIEVEAGTPNDVIESEPYEETDLLTDEILFSGWFEKIKSSEQKTTVKFVINDAFARK